MAVLAEMPVRPDPPRRNRRAERLSELLFYGVVILVGYLAFAVSRPFLAPLAWAAILALNLDPFQTGLTRWIGPTRAALAITFATAVLIVGPLATIISMLASELPQVVVFAQRLPSEATPERVQMVWDTLRERSPVTLPEDPTQLIGQAAQAVLAFLAPRLGGAVADLASMLGSLFVMLFALFFLLRDRERVTDLVRRVLPFSEDERERLMRETHNLVIASVGAGLVVAAVQGLLGGIAFWALGLAVPAAWGVAIGICSLIPVVGAAIVWVPVAGWFALSGDLVRAVVLVGIGAGVISMADNVLRPVLLSGRSRVNGLVVFIGILGGVSAFGYVGLVLGPVVLAIAGTLVEALTRSAATPREPLIETQDQ